MAYYDDDEFEKRRRRILGITGDKPSTRASFEQRRKKILERKKEEPKRIEPLAKPEPEREPTFVERAKKFVTKVGEKVSDFFRKKEEEVWERVTGGTRPIAPVEPVPEWMGVKDTEEGKILQRLKQEAHQEEIDKEWEEGLIEMEEYWREWKDSPLSLRKLVHPVTIEAPKYATSLIKAKIFDKFINLRTDLVLKGLPVKKGKALIERGWSDEQVADAVGYVYQYKREALESRQLAEQELAKLRTETPLALELLPTKQRLEMAKLRERIDMIDDTLENYEGFLTNEPARRGVVGQLLADLKEPVNNFLPFVQGFETWRRNTLEGKARAKYDRGEELSNAEMAYVNSHRAKVFNSYVDKGLGAMVAETVIDMPRYMLEIQIALAVVGTAAAFTSASEKVLKFTKISSPLAQKIFPKIVANSVRMAVAGVAAFPLVGAKMSEYMLPIYEIERELIGEDILGMVKPGDDPKKALTKGIASQVVEYVSEGIGDYIDEAVPFLKKGIISKFLKNKGISEPGAVRKLLRSLHFNSILSEVIEEEVAEPIQAFIDERKYYSILTPEGRERILVEWLGITVFSGMASVSDITINQVKKHRQTMSGDKIEIPVQTKAETDAVIQKYEALVPKKVKEAEAALKTGKSYTQAIEEGHQQTDLQMGNQRLGGTRLLADLDLAMLRKDVKAVREIKNLMREQPDIYEKYTSAPGFEAYAEGDAADLDRQILASTQRQAKEAGVEIKTALEALGVKGERLEKMLAQVEKPKVPEKVKAKEEVAEGISGVFEKATQYTSVGEFAEKEFKAEPADQVGEIDAEKITTKEPIDRAEVERIIEEIRKGEAVELIEVTKEGEELITVEGSRMTAFQEVAKPAPVIYRGEETIPGLRTIEEVYKERAELPVTPKIEKPEIPKELEPMVERAKGAEDEADFVSREIFERSTPGEIKAVIDRTYEGKTFSDKLSTFYTQATRARPAPVVKVVVGGIVEIKSQPQRMKYGIQYPYLLPKGTHRFKIREKTKTRVTLIPIDKTGKPITIKRADGTSMDQMGVPIEKLRTDFVSTKAKPAPPKKKVVKKPKGKELRELTPSEAVVRLEGQINMDQYEKAIKEGVKKGLPVNKEGLKRYADRGLKWATEALRVAEKPVPLKPKVTPKLVKKFQPKEVKKPKLKLFRVKDRQKIQTEAKEVATSGRTQVERVRNIEKYTKELLNQADDPLYKKKLRAVRAEFKRNMYEMVGASTGNWKKDYAFFQALRNNPEISEALDTLEESIFQIDEIINPTKALKTIGYATTQAKPISEFEERKPPKKGTAEFKLFEETRTLIQKYARLIGEGYTPRGALGIYHRTTKNIFVDAINNLSVVAHEVTHFLDATYKISDKLLAIKGFAINGNPIYDPKTLKYRKAITDLYVKYYGGGRKTHKLRKRALEGFATLLQKYIESPQTITNEYPLLVNSFLKEGGEYYHPVMKEIIKDLNKIVEKYQGLNSLEKVGARITSEDVSANKDDFLNFFEKLRTQLVDESYPVEVLAKRAEVHFTVKDPSLWLRSYNSVSGIVNNNIATDRGYWTLRGKGIVKRHDFNWKTLIDTVEEGKITNDFAYYLVARREHFAYLELDKMKEEVVRISKEVKEVRKVSLKELRTVVNEKGQTLLDEAKEAMENYMELKSILTKDGFSRQEVDEAYLENKERFVKEEKMFDTLTKEDLRFLASEEVQLIKPKELERLLDKQGYASFKRQFYNELLGEFNEMPAQARVGKTRVSSMLRRKGSMQTIINPLYSGIANHSEVMRKGLRQVVYNKITTIGTSAAFPDIFQDLDLKVAIDKETGVFHYPQEKDPNIIMGRVDYKRKPVLVDKQVKSIIDNILTYRNIETFTRLYAGLSRMFTAGTTGFYPQFAVTNFLRDQITAQANTTNKYKTLFSPLVQFGKLIADKSSQDYQYYQEYLVAGGERQTFTGWQKLPPDKLFQRIKGERKGLQKAIALMEKGTDYLSAPAKYSELVTRASEYILARKAGKPQIVALEEAGRLTAPFHHLGKWGGPRGQSLIRGLPFFNATLQVLDQSIRTAETKGGRKRMAFVTLVITAAYLVALMALLRADDDQKEQYKDLEAKELANNLYFPHPSGKKLIRVPMSNVFSPLGTIMNMIIADKAMKTGYKLSDYMAAATSIIPDQFNLTEPVNAFLSWIPQIFQAGAETAMGVKTWPTIQPLESMSLKNMPPGMRTNQNTSVFAKWLGKELNLSPIKIDYLLTGYFGRAIGFVTGKPSAYDFQSSVVRDYYFSYGRRVSGAYDLREENDQIYSVYQRGEKKLTEDQEKEVYRVKMLTNDFAEAMREYRKIDIEKDQEKASLLRSEILTIISQIDLKEEPEGFRQWVGKARKRRKKKILELKKE